MTVLVKNIVPRMQTDYENHESEQKEVQLFERSEFCTSRAFAETYKIL